MYRRMKSDNHGSVPFLDKPHQIYKLTQNPSAWTYRLPLLSMPIPELLGLAEFLSQDVLDAFDPKVAGGIVWAG